jgi:hypothetical protein
VAGIPGRKRIYGVGGLAQLHRPAHLPGRARHRATIMSEYAGPHIRGRMVGAVFANQAAGRIVGPLIASIFLASGLSDNLTWRLLPRLGAIPGRAVSACAARSTTRSRMTYRAVAGVDGPPHRSPGL